MSKKKIYTVATAHLDTVWSWDFETTVSNYIYRTLVDNFELFKKYPTYTFSFEGSYRYELMEEYYPEEFEQLKKYIADGRWHVTGSAYENGDVNCPSPEALFRNILFGNSYFDEKFGKRSLDIYLPDCFGFGWTLPSIAYHANLCGFTTQKLAWGSAYGVPFDIGKWYGVDGNYIYASTNPHDYYFTFTKLRDWDFVTRKLKENEKYGLDWTYMFHGTGDRGGSPAEDSVKFVEEEIKKNDTEEIEVVATSADQLYRDIKAILPKEVEENLPTWNTELVMQNHGVGGYTSRAIGKRWNAKCQDLGDIAERAGVMSMHFGADDYNEAVLEKSWKRAVAHQFHDDTPGTSAQRVYRRSWNDYAMSINQFSGEVENSLSAISKSVKSDFCKGTPIMVYNSLEIDRKGVVTLKLKNFNEDFFDIYDDNNKKIPSQLISNVDGVKTIIFNADVKSLGVRVYDIRPTKKASEFKSKVSATETSLENQKYLVTLDRMGNIKSIVNKKDNDREILEKPIVFGLFDYTGSQEWPAWEMNFNEANKEPDRFPKVVSVQVVERGPVRSAVEVKLQDKKSQFSAYICLSDGGEVVEVYNEIEWQSMRTLCKNRFAFTASNEKATFDLGLGAIERTNMNEKLFEVPAQRWADITDKSGEFGVSVISECKHGWDKYNDNTLRLTALHTPKWNYRIDSMQSMMDLGLNKYAYAVYSHKGSVGADTQLQARLFTTPLVAMVIDAHDGTIPSNYSFGSVSTNDVIVRAIKKAHHKDTNEIVVRFNEGANKTVDNFEFTLGDGIKSATELWASEEHRNDATVVDGKLVCSFKPYEVKTFSVVLKAPENKATKATQKPVELEYSNIHTSIPDRLLPKTITTCGVTFNTPKNALMVADGQTIAVEKGNSLKLLCASLGSDIDATFKVDGKDVVKTVNSAYEAFARWDLYDFGETAYIKDGHLGYEFTHTEDEQGKTLFAKGMYFWVVTLDGTTVLPKNKNLVILAATEVEENNASLVTPLMDEIENNRPFTYKKNLKECLWYLEAKMVYNLNDKSDYFTHNNNGKNGKRVEPSWKNPNARTIEKLDRDFDK